MWGDFPDHLQAATGACVFLYSRAGYGASSPVTLPRPLDYMQIEALDMGRRGLHDEGSELLRERLKGKIEVDFDTARRLFTLLCVLHLKG